MIETRYKIDERYKAVENEIKKLLEKEVKDFYDKNREDIQGEIDEYTENGYKNKEIETYIECKATEISNGYIRYEIYCVIKTKHTTTTIGETWHTHSCELISKKYTKELNTAGERIQEYNDNLIKKQIQTLEAYTKKGIEEIKEIVERFGGYSDKEIFRKVFERVVNVEKIKEIYDRTKEIYDRKKNEKTEIDRIKEQIELEKEIIKESKKAGITKQAEIHEDEVKKLELKIKLINEGWHDFLDYDDINGNTTEIEKYETYIPCEKLKKIIDFLERYGECVIYIEHDPRAYARFGEGKDALRVLITEW